MATQRHSIQSAPSDSSLSQPLGVARLSIDKEALHAFEDDLKHLSGTEATLLPGGGCCGGDHEKGLHQPNVPITEEGYDAISGERIPTGSKRSSIINLCNTILGAGMLTLPDACASMGLLPGILLILLSAGAGMFGLYLLSESARFVGRRSSFFALCNITYPSAALLFDFAIMIKCFGVSISYIILIGDLMHESMLSLGYAATSLVATQRFWMASSMAIIVPLAFLKKLDSMKYTSFLALIAVVYLVIIMVVTAISPFAGATEREPFVWGKVTLSGFEKLPIYIFAFTCHQNIFAVFNEMKDNSSKAMKVTIGSSVAICAFVYELIGIIGYVSFGSAVKGIILSNLGSSMWLVVCRIGLSVLFVFSYSLQSHPARACCNRLINHLPRWGASKKAKMGEEGAALKAVDVPTKAAANDDMSLMAYLTITTVMLIASFLIAFFCASVNKVLQFVGSTASTSICYILPGILYYKLHQKHRWTAMKVGSVVILVAGCLFVPILLGFQIYPYIRRTPQ